MFEERLTRREVIKRAAYITPVILTVLAAPSFASGGSGGSGGSGKDERDRREKKDVHGEIKFLHDDDKIKLFHRDERKGWGWD
jgi:hypothetical protein